MLPGPRNKRDPSSYSRSSSFDLDLDLEPDPARPHPPPPPQQQIHPASPQPNDPSRLAPSDAFHAHSPPRPRRDRSLDPHADDPRRRRRGGSGSHGRSRSRRNREWKKLLWIKQPYPDNYTDAPTFLSHLQFNPRLQPYDFWPLVADSTVIVQHVCSVAVFGSCFVGIYQERAAPVAVVGWATACTVLAWVLWDAWLGQEAERREEEGGGGGHPRGEHHHAPPWPPVSSRAQRRLATAKSALLIYCALLGLSPMLKSLTKSTTSDSIWAMSCWLMCINVFFFDYGGGKHVKFPASLSTNAALMASTVLASRLPSTTHVFSLTLFSIEVFGLFPVFRRHLRHRSWYLHVLLTVLLIVGAGIGLGVVLAARGAPWKRAAVGVLAWGLGTVLAMGACSWWLIGLQRYKNVVIGPWDPARPVIRAGAWD